MQKQISKLPITNDYVFKRVFSYAGKMIAGQLQEGDKYTELKKTIVIFIMNFNYIKRNSYHHIARMKYDETTEENYVDMGYPEEEEIAAEVMVTSRRGGKSKNGRKGKRRGKKSS